ncbi:DoxX family protein [Aquimarina sp. 2201CG5-10]|nr:DoxX family protein [Aquimarina sp. 2201CG5-10]MDY8134623.1 DoxX family protein [Aquimarina sp. 2201CG5-10]
MNSKVILVFRILFGLFCLFFGLNSFIGFMEFPPIPGDGGTLLGIYATSGFFKLIAVLEIVGGIALLIGKFIPASLIILIAIMFNAAVFHVLHDMAGIGGSLVGLILGLILVYGYKDKFSSILNP